MKSYLFLLIAICFEVMGTTILPYTQQFTRWKPTLLFALCFGSALFFFSKSIKTIPIGVAYAVWSGIGIILISAAAYLVHKQKLDIPAVIGITFIIVGVLIINIFSKTAGH